jgi:four helix bundle protein
MERRNLNRGYMKLDVWQKAIALYNLVWKIVIDAKIDFKLRAQSADAAQSVASNIAEGYSRRSINEYMQHLYISLGSLSEVLTRLIGFRETGQITPDQSEQIDILHYEVENKLWHLIKSLENKKKDGTWIDRISEESPGYDV